MKKAANKVMAFGLFVIVLLFLFTPQKALAAETVDGFSYTVSVSGTGEDIATITGYNGLGGDIIIPATINDGVKTYTVTSIGAWAFFYRSNLTSVTISEGVTSIGDNAFYYCAYLTSVMIPNSITSIGDYAFSMCSRLANVSISEGVTSIGDYAFMYCDSLTSVTIPASVISIGTGAFEFSGMTDATFLSYDASSISMGYDVFAYNNPNFKIYYLSEDQGFTNPWYGYPTELLHIGVTGVILDPTAVIINMGDTTNISATVSPENATNKNVAWTSSDENVATVDQSGMVTAVGAGSATITVTTEDNGFVATCDITVEVPVTGVTMDPTSVTINTGETTTIVATVSRQMPQTRM